PLIAQAVICNPIEACSPLVNASAIAGHIAVCQRQNPAVCNFATASLNCFNAGAIAVVGTLSSGNLGTLPTSRGGGATVPIPCLQITYTDGTNILAKGTTGTDSPLVMRISGDGSQVLGQFSGGRGASDTLFTFTVPMAGLYPLRLIWENGGGDANSEWFTVDSLGNKILVNDPSSTVKAWTSRTV